MIARRILGTLFASIVFCTLGGGVIGWTIGAFCPSYYRTVFGNAADHPALNPVEIGISLGLMQGALAGLIVGCIASLLVAWVAIRSIAPTIRVEEAGASGSLRPYRRGGLVGCLVLCCAGILVLALGVAVGTIVGGVAAERAAYARSRAHRVERIEAALEQLGLNEVQIYEGSGLAITLGGTVPTAADCDRLRAELLRLLGEPEAEDLMGYVSVQQQETAAEPPS